MSGQQQNWAANYSYKAASIHRPSTVEEIQEIVSRGTKVKALGTRHSFNDIADTTEDLISTEELDRIVSLEPKNRTVTVEAGVTYGKLCPLLDEAGFAVLNMASLPHISVAGACATATHGSGDRNGNLSTAVSALEMIVADGTLVSLSREKHGDRFLGSVVDLGALGVVVRVTLDVVPAFEMSQHVYENLSLTELDSHFEAIESSAYSVSLFTDWTGPIFNQVWLKSLTDGTKQNAPSTFFGAEAATTDLHPIPGASAINCTAQMGVAGPWHERLPHFRMDFTPSSGEELQTEYLVPRPNAIDALHAVDRMRESIAPLLQICEVRTIADDQLWMSPCYRQPCVGIHFTWKKDPEGVGAILPKIESELAPFQARPHWGKLFSVPPARVASLYERLPDFRKLAEGYDPNGKFRNGFLNRFIYG